MPTLAPGAALDAAFPLEVYSAALEAELLPLSKLPAQGGEIKSLLVRAGLRACRNLAWVGLCVHASGGLFHSGGEELGNARSGTSGALWLGPLARAERPISARVSLSLSLGLDLALIRNTVFIGDIQQWKTPVAALVASLGAGWTFP